MGEQKGRWFCRVSDFDDDISLKARTFQRTRKTYRLILKEFLLDKTTRFSWLNCALRGDEAVYWVNIGEQWLVLGGSEIVSGGTKWQLP